MIGPYVADQSILIRYFGLSEFRRHFQASQEPLPGSSSLSRDFPSSHFQLQLMAALNSALVMWSMCTPAAESKSRSRAEFRAAINCSWKWLDGKSLLREEDPGNDS